MILAGIRVIESVSAVTTAQTRRYPKRKAKTLAHGRRMNKKWLKRYGLTHTPAMFRIRQPSLLSPLGEEVIVAHPAMMAQLREVSKQEARSTWASLS